MNRFHRNTLLLILGALLVAVGQVFMIREQNLGAENGLVNLSNRIEESMITAQALITQVDDSIDKKEQMLVNSTHLDWAGYELLSQTLQSQGIDFLCMNLVSPYFGRPRIFRSPQILKNPSNYKNRETCLWRFITSNAMENPLPMCCR